MEVDVKTELMQALIPIGLREVKKLLEEVITLSVFVPFSTLYLKEKLSLDYLWAGLCLLGAIFFLFRGKIMGP